MSQARKRYPTTWKGFAIYCGALVVALFFVGLIIDQAILPLLVSSSDTIIVPNVAGKNEEDARSELQALGLAVPEPHEQYSDKLPAGKVISQMPFAGSTVKEGRRIHLTISSGIEQIIMPSLSGMSVREARLNLLRAGLLLGDIAREKNDSILEDRVIAQSHPAGSKVKGGTSVSILISDGPKMIVMPDLFGMSLQTATSILQDYGLTVGSVFKTPSGTFEPNTVLSSTPPSDSLVSPGASVTLTVSSP